MSSGESTYDVVYNALLESISNTILLRIEWIINDFYKKEMEILNLINKKLSELNLESVLGDVFNEIWYKFDAEISNLRERIKKDIEESMRKQKDLNVTLERVASLMKDLESSSVAVGTELSKENERLKGFVEELQSIIKGKDEEISRLNGEIDEMRRTLMQRESEVLSLKEELTEMKSKLALLSKTSEERSKEAEEVLNLVRKMKEDYLRVKEENSKLENELSEILKKYDEALYKVKVYEEKIKELSSENETLKGELTKMNELTKEMRDEINKLREELNEIYMYKEEYVRSVMRKDVMEILLTNDPRYASFVLFADKIARGVFEVNAEEIGYKREGISLAAWLSNFYGDLEKKGLVEIEVKTEGGYPKGIIKVTEKGKRLFIEARKSFKSLKG
ncbi:MAG: hypothetical protein ACTSVF_00595 [Candidatus Asgardarchaeia archaeon]